MVLMLTAEVIGRRVFNHPLPSILEMTEFLLVIVVMFALADCQFHNGHVSIGVLVDKLPEKGQRILDILTYLLGTGIFALMAWRNITAGMYYIGVGESRGTLEIPVYPFVFAFAFGCIVMALVLAVQLIAATAKAVKK
jgi:TRAP-type C4-dicarboxylate transport system permease small subunit